ncbi:MAG: 30S ribosomal protein S20 [Patescibacteria group bacterium]
MAITTSAKKALRQNRRRRIRNLASMKTLREALKSYRKAPSEKLLATVYARLDKAGKVNLIPKNKASRLKSRLSKLLKTASR